jgi:hypothetical protein
MTAVTKIDSNVTGLRYAIEASLGTLPGSPIWKSLEPNSYGDFGGAVTTVARNPINDGRQRKKGVVTDVEASASFEVDLTQDSHDDLFRGFMYAAYRQKATIVNVTVDTEISGVTGSTFTVSADGDDFVAGDLIFGSSFTEAGNNGLFEVASSTTTTVVVVESLTTEATVPLDAKIEVVGFEFGSGEVDMDATTYTLPRIVRASGVKDFTDFGLNPGEFIFIGGDLTAEKFATAGNNGFARVRSVAATYIELDKSTATLADETGTALTIRLFFGKVIKNEVAGTIARETYQLERTLGAADDSLPGDIQSEYVIGAVPNEITFNIPSADKLTAEMAFMGKDHETRSGATGVKSGTRPTLVSGDAFNTSSDITRIRMSTVSSTDSFNDALYAFLMEASITIRNNNTRNQAVGIVGAFEHTAGTFEVGGEVTAYFADVAAIATIRANANVTFDIIMAKNNAGYVFDIPLVTLSGGLAQMEANEAIKMPLSQEAAEATEIDPTYNHTLMIVDFAYLPTAAE